MNPERSFDASETFRMVKDLFLLALVVVELVVVLRAVGPYFFFYDFVLNKLYLNYHHYR
jgi:hypothetical protein